MFTGLVEELAVIRQLSVSHAGAEIELAARRIMDDMKNGDSISVNGICLTVVRMTKESFFVEAVPETLRRTNLQYLKTGDQVHVERAMAANGRLGGHIVSGHIDGVGRVEQIQREGMARVLTISAESSILKYVVEKGSICVDGVSLTVMGVLPNAFKVSIIPHTQGVTQLGRARKGDVVNLECDVIAKYVERLLGLTHKSTTGRDVTLEFLQQHGYA